MLIELTATTRKRLLQDGYSLAREYNETNKERRWPDDPPTKKNRLVLVPCDSLSAQEWFLTSTRGISIGRELPGGPMGDRYGIICAENDDGDRRSEFVLGGGKVQPDFDGTSADRLWDGEDCEFVRGAMVSENDEELRFPFTPNWDPEMARNYHRWGNRYFNFGVRAIIKRVTDPETLRVTTAVDRDAVSGLPLGDACFMTITHERLGHFGGQKGETGPRHVMPASKLLHEGTRKELSFLPWAQATVLALAIVGAKEIFGKDMPPELAEIVLDGEYEANRVLQNNIYAKHFTKVFQEDPWEV